MRTLMFFAIFTPGKCEGSRCAKVLGVLLVIAALGTFLPPAVNLVAKIAIQLAK